MRVNPILSAAVWLSAVFAPSILGGVARAAGPGVEGRVLEVSEEGRVRGVIPNATVEFLDESGQVAGSTNSNAQGFFRTDLTAGRYYFRVTAEGFRTEDAGRGIVLDRNEGYVVQNFSLVRGESPKEGTTSKRPSEPVGLFTGRVLAESPASDPAPVPGARITLRREGEIKTRVVSGRQHGADDRAAGAFQIRLPAGLWHTAVDARGFQRLVDPKPVEVKAGETSERTFLLKRLAPHLPAD